MILIPLLHSQRANVEEWKFDDPQQKEAEANTPVGTVSGTVIDDICNHPISSAGVLLVGTRMETQSDKSGRYSIKEIPAGYYKIEADRFGYKRAVVDSVLIRPNEDIIVNIRMVRQEMISDCEGTCLHVKYAEPAIARYSDTSAVFQVQLALESSRVWNRRLICILTIENRTLEALQFPLPMIMPFAGDTNKNSIRIYGSNGSKLQIMGMHADWPKGHDPMVTIDGGTFRSWAFMLDRYFKDFWRPGEYEIEFWYFSEVSFPGAWQGRVEMPRIPYSIVKDGE